jgi:hypothetical protein
VETFEFLGVYCNAYTIEPFEPGFLNHGSLPTDRSLVVFPSNIDFAWTKAPADEFVVADAMRLSAAFESLPVVDAEIQDRQDLMYAAPSSTMHCPEHRWG